MDQSIIQSAIQIAKNKTVQRTVIGACIGGAVGFAVAKTVEPYLFQETTEEYEMIAPYDGPDENAPIIWPEKVGDPIAKVTSVSVGANGVDVELMPFSNDAKATERMAEKTVKATPKQKYSHPVVKKAEPGSPEALLEEKPVAPKLHQRPVDVKASVFSTRESASIAGGGDPHKKAKPSSNGGLVN